MTQEEAWNSKYREVVAFIEREHPNPSRYNAEERGLYCNWLKHNKKLYKAGELKSDRVEKFRELLALMDRWRRKNQYE